MARLMRENSIAALRKSKYIVTTNSKHDYPVWPNILCRNFMVDRPNAIWVSDITYIWTLEGWLYLAAILDLFSRMIVGLAMDKTIADTLVLQAMRQAILRRNPKKGLILHSDRGSQYAGNDFKVVLSQNEFIGSMSRKGNCWDNAPTESLWGSLKVGRLYGMRFETQRQAMDEVIDWLTYYNHRRLHSTLDYISPMQFEKNWFAAQLKKAA